MVKSTHLVLMLIFGYGPLCDLVLLDDTAAIANCTVPEVQEGRAVNITFHFGNRLEDADGFVLTVRKSGQRDPLAMCDWMKLDNMTKAASCEFNKGQFQYPDFQHHQLIFTILSTAEHDSGNYSFSLATFRPGEKDLSVTCTLKVTTDRRNEESVTVAVVIAVVLTTLVIVLCVLCFIRRSQRSRCQRLARCLGGSRTPAHDDERGESQTSVRLNPDNNDSSFRNMLGYVLGAPALDLFPRRGVNEEVKVEDNDDEKEKSSTKQQVEGDDPCG